MRRAGPLLLIAVAGCSAPQAEQVAPSQAAYLPPPPVETYEADYVLVDKSDRTLTLYSHGIAIERYTGLQLGGEDGRTLFMLTARSSLPGEEGVQAHGQIEIATVDVAHAGLP